MPRPAARLLLNPFFNRECVSDRLFGYKWQQKDVNDVRASGDVEALGK